RCGHAEGSVSAYVDAARKCNITHLGFSDHVPLPDNRWNIRMPYSELPLYVRDINQAQEKYTDIEIYLGAECDFSSELLTYFEDELIGEYQFDYLIGGVHFIQTDGEWLNCYHAENNKRSLITYTDNLLEVIACDLFSFIVHPDLFGVFYDSWDDNARSCSKEILKAASSKNRIFEINGSGYRKKIRSSKGMRRPYPLNQFWEMAAEYDIPVTINSDAHRPEDINNFGDGFLLADKLELKIVDPPFI
ncbi:MAG TPA: histidinol phosphatase, partial [Spirochaeta sp.]|nr:histidinol phosphatase [Spirochaeta sp.]